MKIVKAGKVRTTEITCQLCQGVLEIGFKDLEEGLVSFHIDCPCCGKCNSVPQEIVDYLDGESDKMEIK